MPALNGAFSENGHWCSEQSSYNPAAALSDDNYRDDISVSFNSRARPSELAFVSFTDLYYIETHEAHVSLDSPIMW